MDVDAKQAKVLKLIEKYALTIGGGLLLGFGLLFVFLADILIKGGSGPLFIDAITLVAGGVLILFGQTQNAFEIKIKWIVMIGIGLYLALAGIIYLPNYASTINEAAGYTQKIISRALPLTYITFGFAIGGFVSSIIGLFFHLFRFESEVGCDND